MKDMTHHFMHYLLFFNLVVCGSNEILHNSQLNQTKSDFETFKGGRTLKTWAGGLNSLNYPLKMLGQELGENREDLKR